MDNLSPLKTKRYNIKSSQDIREIHKLFMMEDAIDFMTNLAKIALDMKEDIIAAIIVNQYYFRLNEGMIKFAIAN